MPIKDLRARMTTTGRRKTAGKWRVDYRNSKGQSMAATVMGPGSVSGLKLNIESHVATRIIDNVPVMTARNQTNVYQTHPIA